MIVLDEPRFTYANGEGLRMRYDAGYDELLPELVSAAFEVGDGAATCLKPGSVDPDDLIKDVYEILRHKSDPDTPNPSARQKLLLEASAGGYGFRYGAAPEFRDQLASIFAREDLATATAGLCLESMDLVNPHSALSDHELEVYELRGGYLFTAGSYELNIGDGSIRTMHFGGDAGLNTAWDSRQPSGDTIHHYNNDYAYQKLGLFLGMGSLAHSTYQHLLRARLAGVLDYQQLASREA
ncbi:MAG: hypothetical protein AAB971_00450 [Patescibacteria group bacterium]